MPVEFTLRETKRLMIFASNSRDRGFIRIALGALLLMERSLEEILARQNYILEKTFLEYFTRLIQTDPVLDTLADQCAPFREALGNELESVITVLPPDFLARASNKGLLQYSVNSGMKNHQNKHDLTFEPLSREDCALARLITGTHQADDDVLLVRALNYPHKEIRRLAAMRVGAHTSIEAIAAQTSVRHQQQKLIRKELFTALDNGVVSLNEEVIDVLGKLRDPQGVKYLALTVSQSTPLIRVAVDALARIANDDAIELLVAILANNSELCMARKALRVIGKPAASALLRAFEDSPLIRKNAGQLLGELAGKRALGLLVQAMSDPSSDVRKSAIEGMAVLGFPAFDVLATRAIQGPLNDRFAAIEAVARFQTARSFKLLTDVFLSHETQIQCHVIQIVAEIPGKQALQILFLGLDDPNGEVRLQSLSALSQAIQANRKHFDSRYGQSSFQMFWRETAPDDPDRHRKHLQAIEQDIARALVRGMCDEDATIEKTARTILLELWPHGTDEALEFAKETAQDKVSSLLNARTVWLMAQAAASIGIRYCAAPPYRLERPQPTPEIPTSFHDYVHFTVTAPRSLIPGQSFILDVWAHHFFDRQRVLYLAQSQSDTKLRVRSKGPAMVERNRVLQVIVQIQDFGIDNLEDTIYWIGEEGNGSFRVTVPMNIEKGIHFGQARVVLDTLEISRVHFELHVGMKEDELDDVTTSESRVMRAFASYATEDREEVLGRIQGMLKALPYLDIFFDVASLRSGENWEERIKEEIAARDIFYLFWSLAASQSLWVEREWRTALSTRGITGIDPVPLESPDKVPPPPELAALHFNDWTLAYRSHHK